MPGIDRTEPAQLFAQGTGGSPFHGGEGTGRVRGTGVSELQEGFEQWASGHVYVFNPNDCCMSVNLDSGQTVRPYDLPTLREEIHDTT